MFERFIRRSYRGPAPAPTLDPRKHAEEALLSPLRPGSPRATRSKGNQKVSQNKKRAVDRPFSHSLSQHSVRPKRLELPTF